MHGRENRNYEIVQVLYTRLLGILPGISLPIMENQTEKPMEINIETGVIDCSFLRSFRFILVYRQEVMENHIVAKCQWGLQCSVVFTTRQGSPSDAPNQRP